MKKTSRREKPGSKSRTEAPKKRIHARMITLLLIAGVVIAGACFLFHGKQIGAQSLSPPVAPEPVAATEARAGFDRLKGRWRRPDGGYVIEIKEIDARGKMAAAYFNPRPINVSRAEASQDGTATKVFIELRDTNYPGATYTLTYDPVSDQLRGVYVQPAIQQSFDVVFVRLK